MPPPLAPRLLALFFAAALPAAFAVTPVDSSVTAVTVYLDRAVVTRTATVGVAAGEQELVFNRLPDGLVDDSLHVAGSGSAQATILDVATTVDWPDKVPDERVRAVQDELKAEQKQLRVLTDRGAALEKERALVTRMADAASLPGPTGKDGTTPARMAPAEMQQLLEYYRTSLDKLAQEGQELDAEKDPLNEKIAATKAKLGELNGSDGKSVKNVAVRVNVAQAGQLNLALSYALSGAQWRPTYEARVSSADRKLTLGYYGIVSQSTGEDWKSVALTLSTAHPSVGGSAPELSPWYVDRLQPRPMSGGRPRGEYRADKSLAAGGLVGAPYVATEPVELEKFTVAEARADVAVGATSATFRIQGLTAVPSDNGPHKEGIAQIPLTADFSYQTTPKLMAAAYLSAAVTNSSDYPILAGPMAVFLDETFVANARTKTVMPGEKFELALGVDDGIKVERKVLNRFTEDLGIITKQSRITYDILITVTNHRRDAVKLTVKDQVPVSGHEKVEVVQVAPSPDDLKPDAQGILEWKLDLAPGEKRELPLKFSVTYPNDLPVSGLE